MPWLLLSNNQVLNVVVYDGVSAFPLTSGQSLVNYNGPIVPVPGFGWNGTDPVPPTQPAETALQAAQRALKMGVSVTSTSTPSINATYAINDAAMSLLGLMYNKIERAGGIFPAGVSTISWSDAAGAPHAFASVPQFLQLEDGLSTIYFQLKEVIATGIVPETPIASTLQIT